MSELRTEFERWAMSDPDGLILRRLVDDRRYESMETERAWQGFQSGHAAGLEDAAKECERPTADGTMYVHYGVRQAAAAIRALKEPK